MQRSSTRFLAVLLFFTLTSPLFFVAHAQQPAAQSTANPLQATSTGEPAQREYFNLKNGHLNLKLHNRSLAWILEMISDGSEVAIISAEGVGIERVSLELKDVTLEEGLRKILKDHDSFFFYAGDPDSPASLRAVWVYPKGRARGVQPVPVEQWASTKELEGQVDDPDPEVRSKALMALVERKGDDARAAVLRALEDKDPKVRMRALFAARERDLVLPASSVMNLVSDESETVRVLALEALAGHPDARVFAQRALSDPSEYVRNKAQEILARLDRTAGPPILIQPPVQGQQQPRVPR